MINFSHSHILCFALSLSASLFYVVRFSNAWVNSTFFTMIHQYLFEYRHRIIFERIDGNLENSDCFEKKNWILSDIRAFSEVSRFIPPIRIPCVCNDFRRKMVKSKAIYLVEHVFIVSIVSMSWIMKVHGNSLSASKLWPFWQQHQFFCSNGCY